MRRLACGNDRLNRNFHGKAGALSRFNGVQAFAVFCAVWGAHPWFDAVEWAVLELCPNHDRIFRRCRFGVLEDAHLDVFAAVVGAKSGELVVEFGKDAVAVL